MSTEVAELVEGLHHVSFVVADLDRSIAFYEPFGFRVHDRWAEGPDKCAVGLGVPEADIELVQLVGAGFMLEFIQYKASGGGDVSAVNDLGNAHIAFRVRDIEKAAAALRAYGTTLISDVQYDPTATWLQFEDPDGIRVELIGPPGTGAPPA